MKRGDIYYADLNPVVGSEQGSNRPCLIVQNNTGNKHSPTVIVTPITGKINKNPLPTHVLLPKSCGLERDSLALTEQIRAIDRARLGNYIGHVGKSVMSKIDVALSVSVGLVQKENGGVYHMKNEETVLTDNGGEKPRATRYDRRKRIDESKRITDPHNFEHDGIKVRVFFEGTADLNELVKGLFMTG